MWHAACTSHLTIPALSCADEGMMRPFHLHCAGWMLLGTGNSTDTAVGMPHGTAGGWTESTGTMSACTESNASRSPCLPPASSEGSGTTTDAAEAVPCSPRPSFGIGSTAALCPDDSSGSTKLNTEAFNLKGCNVGALFTGEISRRVKAEAEVRGLQLASVCKLS